jgi:hypothetical protein
MTLRCSQRPVRRELTCEMTPNLVLGHRHFRQIYYLHLHGRMCTYAESPTSLKHAVGKICKVLQKELYNDVPNVSVWRVLRKRLHVKAYKAYKLLNDG